MPSVGEVLVDPLLESPYIETENEDVSGVNKFQSVLDDLENLEINEQEENSQNILRNDIIYTEVCKAYEGNEKEKVACENALILQAAILTKDIEKCTFIDETYKDIRGYCEFSIIQDDALKAAEAAKEYCNLLTLDESRINCLQELGFLNKETPSKTIETIDDNYNEELTNDCLDYGDPLDRIECMRMFKE